MNSWRIRAHGCFEQTVQEPPDSLAEPLRACVANPPRRINRYIQLALIGAHRCVGGLGQSLPTATPMYIASEQANAAEVINLFDDIVWQRRSPKPMSFVNVSSNMVGFYLAASLGLNGRNINVARTCGAFGAMLELARLEPYVGAAPEGPVLLGTVAEATWPLADHRRRCELSADTPIAEASYWLAVDNEVESGGPRLTYGNTNDEAEARAWLADGERWVVDPHLPEAQGAALSADLDQRRKLDAALCHRGHLDAVAHAVFTALQAQPRPRVHVVAGDPSGGYQLMGVC